ncbi:hypothetical protein [Lutispora sp.]|uniref:hypothetical protein n=1 Tax=Lutispora sp. TaxID=2828727 RepID=UPI00356998BB
MRKHKLFAVLMAAVLMLASIQGVTVHAESIGVEAQVCRDLGLLQGDGANGVTSQYLSTNPTRLQVYIIALKLKGLYNEAGKYIGSNNFKDVSEATWAKSYLAYAKNTPELGWTGYADGRFGINDAINAQAFYKVLLEILEYKQNVDFTYAETFEFAEKIGLVENVSETKAISNFTTNDLAKGIYRALSTNAAGKDKRLVDVLADKGVIKPEMVETLGLNFNIQLNVHMENNIGWVPLKDTYEKMKGYVTKTDKNGVYYEVKKGSVLMKISEGINTVYLNNNKFTLEKPIIKGKYGEHYIPASFVVSTAKDFGYEGKYLKEGKILELRELPSVKASAKELVLLNGNKIPIKVEKKYSGIKEDVTSQCTYTVTDGGSFVHVVSTTGEVTGKALGSAEIAINYAGNEVDRVTVHVVEVVPKYYPVSRYEQVFEPAFRLDKPDYKDTYGVVWNKMSGVIASTNESDGMDTESSLNLLNYSNDGSGITVDLSKLLENRAIRGKTCTVKLYVKGITESPTLYVKASSKSKYQLETKENTIILSNIWKSTELIKIDIPQDATEFKMSIGTGKNQEIRIDAFTIITN